jgi:hypothetical protein
MPENLFLYILLFIHSAMAFAQTDVSTENSNNITQKESLNMLAIGYHIGGLTYIGAEYEYRFSRHIGLNAGAGISGITAGIKIHSCPCQTGPFLNIAFKDGGFGKEGTINFELGGVLLPISKDENIGIIGQVGFGKFIYLSDAYKDKYTNQGKTREYTMSFGLGLSIYFQ